MKVLSLLQPWATLVVIGAKKLETRSWNTSFHGDILIHASAKMSRQQKEITYSKPFWDKLKHLEELPLGAIIGKVRIIATVQTTFVKQCYEARIPLRQRFSVKDYETELAFGDYTDGRHAWLLKDPVMFKYPTQIKGSLSLWDCPIRICSNCGCIDNNCRGCIERTGKPCFWVKENLCSACI